MELEEALKTLKENLCNICSYYAKNMESCDIGYCDNRAAIRILEKETKKSKDIHLPLYKVGDRIEPGTDGNTYKLSMSNGKEFEQQSSEDCVSREYLLDDSKYHTVFNDDTGVFEDVVYREDIKNAPSITPKGVTVTDFADKCRECGKQETVSRESYEHEYFLRKEFEVTIIKLEKTIEELQKQSCKDCVSRQAVHDGMIKYGFHSSDMTITEFVKDVLPPVTPTTRWIPVSERMPEDRENILFSTKTGRVFEGRFFDDNTDLQWYEYRCEKFEFDVTAWQPLPKSYEAEIESKEDNCLD